MQISNDDELAEPGLETDTDDSKDLLGAKETRSEGDEAGGSSSTVSAK